MIEREYMAKGAEEYKWHELNIGGVIDEPGNAQSYLTGDWRSIRPIWDESKCIECGVCWMFCPDAAVYQKENKKFVANYDYCKGCGICAKECWPRAITMVEEEK
jgi:pyruvate ferredoxin oxidoreductase delta subunit